MIDEEEEFLNIKSVVDVNIDKRRDTQANYEQMKIDALERC